MSSIATPGANGAGSVTTTVRGSGAVTASGWPFTRKPVASTLSTFGSYSALNVKTTSSDVNGAPSEKVTPSRSVSVMTRPSGETVHFSASQGSGSSVVRSRRTSDACTSRVTASTAACWALGPRRLNVWGSDRSEAVSVPPRAGAVAAVEEDAGAPRLHAMAHSSAQTGIASRTYRTTLDLIGQ